jgi:N-methylhydantoinase A
MHFKVGIDVGGTFTDLVAFDEENKEISIVKFPSTPSDPSKGVIEAFKHLKHEKISLFVHASTIGTNLFLGQLGLKIPKGALITTSGFKDILEIGRQKRAEIYNPFFERPKPLIEKNLRFTINERINYKGQILKVIDEEEVEILAQKIKQENIETVAIVFLHSYINSEHEKKVKQILKKILPNTVITASYEVDPEYREYERTSTTVVNSLLIPVVSKYLRNIEKKLAVNAPLYVMQSNGGLATVDVASRIPVATIESGPATGVIASAYWSKMLKIENILRVDLAEVSGGGGTIAWIDEGGALRVGPLSAGAEPGPACYGKRGENPTVTDANLILGRLNPNLGETKVFPELAEEALVEKIAKPLNISTVQAASGIIEIVNNHMMRALRLVSIERGYDPRDFVMLAFGGSGPMHATFLAEELDIKDVFIPLNPGVFSALGLILTDFRHDFVRSIIKPASNINSRFLQDIFKDMEKEAAKILQKEGFNLDQIIMERTLDIRYLGQSYEINIPVKSLNEALKLFHLRHQETYGYAEKTEPVEIVNAHLIVIGLIKKPEFKKHYKTSDLSKALINKRKVFFEQTGWIQTPIYLRDNLSFSNQIKGPAIIEQYDATTIIPSGWNGFVDEFLNMHLTKVGSND